MNNSAQLRKLIGKYLEPLRPGYYDAVEASDDPAEIDHAICKDGIITETELLEIYAKALRLPFLDEVEEESFSLDTALHSISPDYLAEYCCFAYESSPDFFGLLVSDPYHLEQHEYFFKRFHDIEVNFKFARRSFIERAVTSVYHSENENEAALIDSADEEALRAMADETMIVRLVNEMFARAIELNASDIHIEPEESKMVIRFRIDGVLQEYLSVPYNQFPAVASRVKLISGLNIAESRLPQDGRTSIKIGAREIDIRISTIPVMNGESIVLRILRKDAVVFDLKNIGMNETLLKKFERLIGIPHGIILVVGPTGSGKTTTLYSVINQLKDGKKKIITVEDPVEYQFPGLSQVQVNAQIGLTFANGLRSIVRQDPDIILVGEIRDRETADIAINAALTGHLVLSTLHTNDASGAVSRLLDMGVEGFLVSSALYGVMSQRLVRVICKECGGSGINYNFTGNRCRACSGTGFKGRTGIYELLIVNEEIRRAISRNASSSEIAKLAVANGMVPLQDDGMAKVAAGITTEFEVTRAASEL
ncbi:MAG: GspE/PulE family protein [Victivallales bacterium]|nr:GspE/PulE family protein [Victivallales bacterium]